VSALPILIPVAAPTLEPDKPRLHERVRRACRVRHYSIRTEQAYVDWARRFIRFHNKRHPLEMGAAEINQFLIPVSFMGWSKNREKRTPDAGPLYSGTQWQLCTVREGVHIFRCLGDVDGTRLLDGRTTDGTVGLMWHSTPSITGILWQASKISDS
jgi:hypothetical protein